jgi:hypothetical protein
VGGHEGVVTALTRSRAFLDLKHAEAKDLLLQVLNVRVDVGGERLTLAQLDARYEEAFEARRDAKARAAAIRVPDAPAMRRHRCQRPEGPTPDAARRGEARLATTAKAMADAGRSKRSTGACATTWRASRRQSRRRWT